MPNFWDRLQAATQAAMAAWRGDKLDDPGSPFGMYADLDDAGRRRVEHYVTLWRYYDGHHRKWLKRRESQAGLGPDDNVIVNFSRRVVNKGVAFLFGEPLNWELTEGETTPEEELLAAIWGEQEKRQIFLQELALNGGVTGDFYVQLLPPRNQLVTPWPNALSMHPDDLPRLVNVNPAIVFPHTNPDDVDDVWAYEFRSRSGDTARRIIHTKVENGETWETFSQVYLQGRWRMEMEPVAWPWPWPMIVHGKNLPRPNDYFGLSDLEDADLNDAINLSTSNINRITRIFAHPIVWGRKVSQADFVDSSQMILSNNPDAMMGALELAGNLQSSEMFLRFLRTAFEEVTQVPGNDPDRLRLGAQSGVALKLLFGDLLDKTKVKRNLYGAALIETNRRLLDMMAMGDEHKVTLHWADPLPADIREQVESDRFDLEHDLVSRETLQRERGYDPDVERERIARERLQQDNLGAELLRGFERGAPVDQTMPVDTEAMDG